MALAVRKKNLSFRDVVAGVIAMQKVWTTGEGKGAIVVIVISGQMWSYTPDLKE